MSSIIFNCECCKYKTKRKYDLNRHQITVHHKNVIKEEEIEEEIKEIEEEEENKEIEEENKEIEENKEFIYLLQEREFIKTKEPIYKIGKTKQEKLKRIKSYPNGSELLFYIVCNNCDKIEKIIINKFKSHFIHKKEFGNEYFMGDYNSMIDTIYNIISLSKMKDNKDNKDNNEDNRCSKCNKFYKTKKSFINHEKSCNGLSILTCPKCMKIFSHINNKNKHIKINNCKAKSINHNIDDYIDDYINDFGNERIDYLENFINKPDIKDLPIHKRLIKYIEYKYFNEEFPENKNVKYKNNNCLIKEDGKWKPKHINNMIIDIIEKNKLIIYTNEDNDDDNEINDNYIKNELKVLIKSSKSI